MGVVCRCGLSPGISNCNVGRSHRPEIPPGQFQAVLWGRTVNDAEQGLMQAAKAAAGGARIEKVHDA